MKKGTVTERVAAQFGIEREEVAVWIAQAREWLRSQGVHKPTTTVLYNTTCQMYLKESSKKVIVEDAGLKGPPNYPESAAVKFDRPLTPLQRTALQDLWKSSNGNGHDFGFTEDLPNISKSSHGGVIASLDARDYIEIYPNEGNTPPSQGGPDFVSQFKFTEKGRSLFVDFTNSPELKEQKMTTTVKKTAPAKKTPVKAVTVKKVAVKKTIPIKTASAKKVAVKAKSVKTAKPVKDGDPCWCGCGQLAKVKRRFVQGHDMKFKGIIKRLATGEIKFGELAAYVQGRVREWRKEHGDEV